MQLRFFMMKWSRRGKLRREDVRVDMFELAPRGRPRRPGLDGELRRMALRGVTIHI